MGFMLDAIHPREGSRVSCGFPLLRGKACDGAHGGNRAGVFMREGNFEAVRETCEGNFQVGMRCGEMVEGVQASFNDRGLQSSDSVALEAGTIRQETCYAASRRCQTGVGIHAHVQIAAFSGHG